LFLERFFFLFLALRLHLLEFSDGLIAPADLTAWITSDLPYRSTSFSIFGAAIAGHFSGVYGNRSTVPPRP
jgi:hypothetical protein